MSRLAKIKELLVFLGIFATIDIVWRVLELIVYGETKPCWVDTIIGMVLAASLYINLTLLIGDERKEWRDD